MSLPKNLLQTIRDTLWLRRETEAFEARFAPLAEPDPEAVITITWGQFSRQLLDLVPEHKHEFVRNLISGSRKLSVWKPDELILRELLIVAGIAQDDTFCPALRAPQMAPSAKPQTDSPHAFDQAA